MISQNKEFWIIVFIILCFILTLRKPFYGYAIFVFLMFLRPQDDRTSLQAYHFPQMVLILTTVSFFYHEVMAKGRPVFPRSKTFGLFILFFAWMLFDSLFSSMPEITRIAVNEFLFIVLLFYLTIQIIDNDKKLKIIFAIILLCGLHFSYMMQFRGSNMVESISGQEFTRLNFVRYNFNFGQPNYLAFTMNIMFFLSLTMALFTKNKLLKILLFSLCPLYLYTLIQTASRGATLAFLITLIAFWGYSKSKIFYLLIFAALIIFILPILKESYPNYFNRLETIKTYEDDASAAGRITLWRTGIDFIKENPFFGIGWGTFGYSTFNSAHNSYIQIASELGLIGFFFWIFFLLASWKQTVSMRRKVLRNDFFYFASLAIELGIIAYIVQSFTSGIGHRELIYFIIAIGVSINSIIKRKNVKSEAYNGKKRKNYPGNIPSY